MAHDRSTPVPPAPSPSRDSNGRFVGRDRPSRSGPVRSSPAHPARPSPRVAAPPRSEDTLLEALRRYERAGFEGQFSARAASSVMCLTCHEASTARRVPLLALHRIEGTSDPGDMVAVAALECPRCLARGTLVAHYGPEAAVEEAVVLRDLKDLRDQSPIPNGL